MGFSVAYWKFAKKSGAELGQESSGIFDPGLILRERRDWEKAPDCYWARLWLPIRAGIESSQECIGNEQRLLGFVIRHD